VNDYDYDYVDVDVDVDVIVVVPALIPAIRRCLTGVMLFTL